MTKRALRQQLRQIMADIAPEQLHQRSLLACQHLTETQEYERAEIIMVFLSLPTEVDTTPLVLHAWRQRKRVLAPKVSWEQRRMLPIEIHSFSDDVAETVLGLREPAKGVPIPVNSIDLVIVPGLGFDHHGFRIGRGRGFYDRFLAQPDWHGTSCGLGIAEQVVDQVPVKEHDCPVDMLVTDVGVQHFRH
jgi:5-formyltetrahydrofolate cyclo-ligase